MSLDTGAMSETAYYILLALVEERHGYGVIQHVQELTGNRIVLGAGTIYGTLTKMEKNKMIQPTRVEEKRKYYQITPYGLEILRQEINRLGELYQNGKGVLSDE